MLPMPDHNPVIIARIVIDQAEGFTDQLVHRICMDWEDAATTLYGICLAKEKDSPRQGYWKTDVVVHFSDGFWRKFRFDACWEERRNVGGYERFAKNTLLWSTSKNHPGELP